MSKSLREALEQRLPGLPVLGYSNGYPTQALPKAELLDLLAMHPAEQPAPVQVEITDEAVTKATRTYLDTRFSADALPATDVRLKGMRAALEAAAPLLGLRPLLDREEVGRAFRRNAGPWLTANRDAVTGAATDAVMELARPIPALEEIATTIHRATCLTSPRFLCSGPHDADRHQAAAVLALLKGDQP